MAAVAKGGAASGLQQLTSLDLTQQQATLVLDLRRKHLPPQPHVFYEYPPPNYNRNGQLVLDPILIRKMISEMGEEVEEKKLGSVDGIVNLELCLSLALLVTSLPHLRRLKMERGFPEEISREGCEQAMGVLFAALAAQGPSAVLFDLMLMDDEIFGTERVCRHLAHLLTSKDCKLERLTLFHTGMRAEGLRHIAEALHTNSTLKELEVFSSPEVGDAGVEHLSAMLPNNATLESLRLNGNWMKRNGQDKAAVEEDLRLNKETGKDNLPDMDTVYEEHDGPTFSTPPICAPAASEMVGSLRPDVVALGFSGFDDAFDSERILFLHKVLEDGGQVQMAFMHPEGMCRVIGVGLPWAVVTVEDLTQVLVEQVTQEEWSRLWTDAVNQQLYSPIVLDLSGQDHPSALDVDVKLSSAESLQRFGLGVVGSDVAFVTCSPGETSSTNDQAMDIDHLTSNGQGNRGVNLASNNLSTSTSDESLAINGEPSQVLKEAEVEKSLTIHVHFRIDATFVPPLPANPDAHLLELNSSFMGTRMIIKFFHLTEFTPPEKGIDVTVDVEYGLQTLERILVADCGSRSRDACQSDKYGWYHDQHLASFKPWSRDASELLESKSRCLAEGNTPNNAGMLTTQTQKTKGLTGRISLRLSGSSFGAEASGSSNESKQYASYSRLRCQSVGDNSRLAFLTRVYPTITGEVLWRDKRERERAEEAGILSSVKTKMWGRWHVFEDTAREYSYTLTVSRNLYMLKKTSRKKYRTEKYQQTVTQTFLVNHKFSTSFLPTTSHHEGKSRFFLHPSHFENS